MVSEQAHPRRGIEMTVGEFIRSRSRFALFVFAFLNLFAVLTLIDFLQGDRVVIFPFVLVALLMTYLWVMLTANTVRSRVRHRRN